MPYYVIEKTFRDYADDIEGVNIHYVVTPIGESPDWNRQRVSRFMPLTDGRIRRKSLRLPLFVDQNGQCNKRYNLHHYFEIIQGGERRYSPAFVEEVVTAMENTAHVPVTTGARFVKA
jgi:hypothetical protein